ncbi:hypothetical protein GQ53DRAFT_763758 [Thozetella sp. PMI_491]|nr:hypothetical protein GQ53DRAFT_763758 [Thozetella sp. PMI_491]
MAAPGFEPGTQLLATALTLQVCATRFKESLPSQQRKNSLDFCASCNCHDYLQLFEIMSPQPFRQPKLSEEIETYVRNVLSLDKNRRCICGHYLVKCSCGHFITPAHKIRCGATSSTRGPVFCVNPAPIEELPHIACSLPCKACRKRIYGLYFLHVFQALG